MKDNSELVGATVVDVVDVLIRVVKLVALVVLVVVIVGIDEEVDGVWVVEVDKLAIVVDRRMAAGLR